MNIKKMTAAFCAILCMVAYALPVMADDVKSYELPLADLLTDSSCMSDLPEAERGAISYYLHLMDCQSTNRSWDVLQGTFFELDEEEQNAVLDAADRCTPYDFLDLMTPQFDPDRNDDSHDT